MTTSGAKIRILVDNHAENGLISEHGLALWVQTEELNILFDTGQKRALVKNAEILGIDLRTIDILVLSHGHYDHTGGIPDVLQQSSNLTVYSHSAVVYPRYSINNGIPKPIHMPRESMLAIDKLPEKQLHWVHQPINLADKIGITGPIPRETSYENTGGSFYLDPEGRRPDPVSDDLALWIRTVEGLVVCVGCSHAGLVNTLNHIRRLNNGLQIRAVIGGFHLMNASPDRLNMTLSALQSIDPALVVPCHCTGETAVNMLRNAFNERVVQGEAGMKFDF